MDTELSSTAHLLISSIYVVAVVHIRIFKVRCGRLPLLAAAAITPDFENTDIQPDRTSLTVRPHPRTSAVNRLQHFHLYACWFVTLQMFLGSNQSLLGQCCRSLAQSVLKSVIGTISPSMTLGTQRCSRILRLQSLQGVDPHKLLLPLVSRLRCGDRLR